MDIKLKSMIIDYKMIRMLKYSNNISVFDKKQLTVIGDVLQGHIFEYLEENIEKVIIDVEALISTIP